MADISDVELATVLNSIVALVEQLLTCDEFVNHAFEGVTPFLHTAVIAPCWSIGTCSINRLVLGDQAKITPS
jgi:hypothetical protein